MGSSSLSRENLNYFNRGARENPEFWAHLGGQPNFRGSFVIDVGCGHGSLCIDIAHAGARKVIGLDTDRELIDFAQENLRTNYPSLTGIVSFSAHDLRELACEPVDYFVSKSTFEHVLNLANLLENMKERLKHGGKIFTAFEPLYPSPYGGHGRIHKHLPFKSLPWGHLLLGERQVLKRVNAHREVPVRSIRELGLNQFGIGDYERIFTDSGLRMEKLRLNYPGLSFSGKVMTRLSKIPFLRKYMIYSLRAVLVKL